MSLVQSGSNIVGSVGTYLGSSVSISGDGNTIVIGSGDIYVVTTGLVRVYRFSSGAWSQIGSDIVGPSNSEFGSSVSISSDGNTIVVGARRYSSQKGLVRVYKFISGDWSQIGSDIIGSQDYSKLGYSVSISSDGITIAVGAPDYSEYKGLVQVYRFSSGAWSQIGSDIIGSQTYYWLGSSLSISSDSNTIVVGVPGFSNSKGLVQVYRFSSGAWSQIGSNIVGLSDYNDLGRSVSITSDGNTIIVGEPGYSSNKGLVRVYGLSSGVWSQIGNDIMGVNNWDGIGWSVSISSDGNTIVVGSKAYSSSKGLVQMYKFSSGVWSQFGSNIVGLNNYEEFGISVSISSNGSTFVTGSPYYSSNSGLIQVYYDSTASIPLVSNVCFPAGTFITTDQEIIAIEKINPDVHTIDGKKITGITKTISSNDFLVCFEKHALGNNIPSRKTIMTHIHEVFYNGKMRKAIDFIDTYENVYKVKYRGEILYNILMEKHDKMEVNDMICETLDPKNRIATLYNFLKDFSPDQQIRICKEYNEFKIKKSILSDKQLKHLNKCL